MTDDHELERAMREGLEQRAGEVDITAPVAARARTAARRRRGGRLAAGAAALAVAAVAVTGVVIDRSSTPGGDGPPSVADPVREEPLPTAWRTEYWHDVAVAVPADWGWGGAPQTGVEGNDVYWCGEPGAAVDSTGQKLRRPDPGMAYVGRPILQSDMCVGGIEDQTPQAPYVWLGAPVEPGTVDLGGGYVRETREVNGSTVSVATKDVGMRERILDSATGGETCFSELEAKPEPHQSPGPEGSSGLVADSLTVCAYRKDEVSGSFALTYAAVLGRAQARALVRAADEAPRVVTGCIEQRDWEFVRLRVDGTSPSGAESIFREYLATFGCDGLQQSGDSATIALTPQTVSPWAIGGIPVTVTGTYGDNGELADYFIGMQG